MRWVFLILLFVAPAFVAVAQTDIGGDFSNGTEPFHPEAKVPQGVILIKGAWASASDSLTPVPENRSLTNGVLRDRYFGITYSLPKNWTEEYEGPPPSDSGRYVLAQLQHPGPKDSIAASILITAQDMFFTSLPARNALQLVNYEKEKLQTDYKLELAPTRTNIAGRPFIFYAYWSPAAGLHWYVLATEIRCHALEIVMMSRDTKMLADLLLGMKTMGLPAEADPAAGHGGGDVPVCMANYANGGNLLKRVEPVFHERTFNPVPVRIIIDKTGKVKHIHFLSAFPSQANAITDAIQQWRFKPYLQNHQPVEVETGIMFGNGPLKRAHSGADASVE